MLDLLTSIFKVRSLVDSSVTLKLLRARNLPLIITFLYRDYKVNEQISVPYQFFVQRLAYFLEEIEYQDEDEVKWGILAIYAGRYRSVIISKN